MIYQSDWLMRQIEMIADTLARLLFNKKSESNFAVKDAAYNINTELWGKLLSLIEQKKFCEAENLLFSEIENGESFSIAIEFYTKLNEFSDNELEDNNFSREEIYDGLKDIARKSSVIDFIDFE